MCKKINRVREMSNAALVDEMAKWSDAVIREEVRGPGDYINAMRRVSKRSGVAYSILFDLKYRKPKKPDPISFARLYEAYVSLRQSQLRQFQDELEQTTKDTGSHSALVRAAVALVGAAAKADGED